MSGHRLDQFENRYAKARELGSMVPHSERRLWSLAEEAGEEVSRSSRGFRAARSTGCGAAARRAFHGNMSWGAAAASIGAVLAFGSPRFDGGWTRGLFGEAASRLTSARQEVPTQRAPPNERGTEAAHVPDRGPTAITIGTRLSTAFYYGRFERRIALPRGVDEGKARADFRDGMLTVTLPNTEEAQRGRRTPIDAEGRQ